MPRKTPKSAIDDRLLDTAIDQFGRKGLEGASTRAIAMAADTAMSSITYHYGGKEGLYLAAARRIAGQIAQRFEAALADSAEPEALSPPAALEQILRMADAFLRILLSPESAAWARFIVREQMEPTEGFTILWDQWMGRLAGRFARLVLRATDGACKPAEARVRAVTLFGQILVFRVARAAALRITGWNDIGSTEAAEIRRVVHAQIRAILTST